MAAIYEYGVLETKYNLTVGIERTIDKFHLQQSAAKGKFYLASLQHQNQQLTSWHVRQLAFIVNKSL